MSFNLEKRAWKRVSLGDVAKASKEKVNPTSGDVERYVAGEHMDTDSLKICRSGQVGEGYLGPAFHRRFRPGQVLYGSRRTYLRKVAVAEFDGVTANTTFAVETRDSGVLRQDFLPFVMSSEPFHAFAVRESKGSVNPYVNWSDIERYEFDLPPLEEQGRLARLLWAMESHRRAAGRQAATATTAYSSFANRTIWRTEHSLAQLSTILESCNYGTSERSVSDPTATATATPVLRIPNVVSGRLSLNDLKYVPESRSNEDRAAALEGDLLIVRTNGNPMFVARGALVPALDRTFLAASYLLRLRPDRTCLDPLYLALAWSTHTMRSSLAPYIRSSAGNYNLSASDVLERSIPLPTLDVQRRTCSSLSTVDVAARRTVAGVDSVARLLKAFLSQIFEDAT